MIITILRWYFKIVLRLYYREIVIDGVDFIKPGKPQLVIANHQNSLIDGLLFISQINKDVILTTTSKLKKFPLADKILRRANVQIFYRRVDGYSDQKQRKNTDAIDVSADLLAENNNLLIFPEGVTTTDGRMLPFKTGFARIVQSYLERYEKDLEIIPMYINYTNRSKIRSKITIDILKPISAKSLEKQYPTDFIPNCVDHVRQKLVEVEESKIRETENDAPEAFNYLDRVLAFPFLLFHLLPSAVAILMADKVSKGEETDATLRVIASVVLFPVIFFLQIVFLISFLPLLWVYFLLSYIFIYAFQYTKSIVHRIRSDGRIVKRKDIYTDLENDETDEQDQPDNELVELKK